MSVNFVIYLYKVPNTLIVVGDESRKKYLTANCLGKLELFI